MTIEHSNYTATVLNYYQDEIAGEAYFNGLAEHFTHPQEQKKLALLARVERCTAQAVRPLLEKYGLTPPTDSELGLLGEAGIQKRCQMSWKELMTDMTIRYPAYIEQFRMLEKQAPKEDLQALKKLTDHEIALVEFAKKEIAGDSDSLEPVNRYIEQTQCNG